MNGENNDEMMRQVESMFRAFSEDITGISVFDAINLLRMYMKLGPAGAQKRKKLVEYMIAPENKVIIDPKMYHNFIMDLFRCGDFYAATDVCKFVLEYTPKNMDMLADMMRACGGSLQFDLGEEYLNKAHEIPENIWSWRLFMYGVDFLITKLQAFPGDQELFSRAENLAKQYMKNFPSDEHGYNQLAEIYVCVNQQKKAVDVLDDFIFRKKTEKREGARLICAQCCVTLLNLLDDSNNYERIVQICERGIDYTTQEQPSANIGFFIYRKALALDAMLRSKNYKAEDVLETMRNYQVAYDLNQDKDYKNTIEKRYALLRVHLPPEKYEPLVRRNLYIAVDEEAETEND